MVNGRYYPATALLRVNTARSGPAAAIVATVLLLMVLFVLGVVLLLWWRRRAGASPAGVASQHRPHLNGSAGGAAAAPAHEALEMEALTPMLTHVPPAANQQLDTKVLAGGVWGLPRPPVSYLGSGLLEGYM